MNTTDSQVIPAPPSLTKSLMAGFDAVTNHIGLILFSIVFDLLLWLGPHVQLVQLVKTFFAQTSALSELNTPEMTDMLRTSQDLWTQLTQQFNLMSVMRTYPVGVPSLMVGRAPTAVPAGQPIVWEVHSFLVVIGLWLAFSLFGLVVGSLYFVLVAQAALTGKVDWRDSLARWPWVSVQVFFLALLWLALLIGLSVPFTCILSLLLVTGISMGPLAILLLGGLMAWILFPLIFSPHGIFTYGRKMWTSVKESIRLTRMTLPTTGLFILALLVLSEGLDALWRVPTETSWLTFVGIAGHAFVTTGLVAASFVYYRDAGIYVEKLLEKARSTTNQDRMWRA